MLKTAVFLDRDGTLTRRAELTWKKSQLELQVGAASFVQFLNKKNIPVIVVTNQPVVARGLISESGVVLLHEHLNKLLKSHKAHIDHFYFCPHHPQATIRTYRKKCICRKPAIGMFKKAAQELSLNLKKSFFIGDMTQDMLAGKRAHMTTILLKKGHRGLDGKYDVTPDYEVSNFTQIIKILKQHGAI